MACDTYKGSDFTLAGQINTGDYGAVPTPIAAALLRFSQLSLNRNPTRQIDPTIEDTVLMPKQDEIDEMPEGSLTTIADLNDATFWMTLLFGTPVTTGGAATSAAKSGGNTGDGTLGTVTVSGANSGVYALRVTAASADAGDFTVTGPDGAEVGTGTVGVEFDEGGLTFTLSDGATDFAEGDGFDITVAAYTHTYTLTNACKPDALLELHGLRPGETDALIRQYLGAMLKDWSWDLMAEEQNFVFNLLMSHETRPFPTDAFDDNAARRPKNRLQAGKGIVYDVDGASTLGYVTGWTTQVTLNPQPRKVADGIPGIGLVQSGSIEISGTAQVLLQDTGISDYGVTQTSKPVTIKSQGKSSGSLTLVLPSVEFSEPANEIGDKNGILRTYNWRAHSNTGDAAVSLVLVNSVAA